jgi:hypothetical protein
MSFQGRSLDDLPLAAYSTGMVEDEPAEDAAPENTDQPMDARAAALSIVEPEPAPPPTPAVDAAPGAPAPGALAQAGAPAPAAAHPARPAMAGSPEWLRDPRLALSRLASRLAREPRLLAGGAIVVGLVLLAGALGGGLTAGGSAPRPTASGPVAAAATPTPAAATISLSGAVTGEYSLTGSAGFGRPAGNHLASTWTDALGSSLTLTGQASAGAQPTGPDLVLTWTVLVDGSAVTFTSRSGECVIGMALKPTTVSGSIYCTKLRSDDGKLVVKASGSYRT